MYEVLSDYFNTPLTSKISVDNSSVICESQSTEFMHKLDTKDYFYSISSFSLLRDFSISKELELFDLFQNHLKESFVRVRNRESNTFKESESKGSKFDPEKTFIFKLEKDRKYTMNGIQKLPKEQVNGFVKNALGFVSRGYHFVKDEILKIDCENDKSVFLKPREIATLKITK